MFTLRERASGFYVDWLTLLIYLVLLGIGWMSVCGASHEYGDTDFLALSTRSGKQLMWIVFSFVLAFVLLMTDEKYFDMLATILYVGMMFLLLITPLLAGNIKGSHSWIKMGSVSLQPAEFAKCVTALALAKVLSQFNFNLQHREDLFKAAAVILLPVALIILQRETGTALVYLAFFFVFYREGMTGSVLFCALAAIIYFVVGLRYAGDQLPYTTAHIGEYVVLIIIGLFTLLLMNSYLPRERTRLFFIRGLVVTIIAYLISRWSDGYDVSIVQLLLILSLVVYLIWQGLGMRKRAYYYIAAFAIGSVAFLYASDMALHHILAKHQRERVEVLLGTNKNINDGGYNVHQSKIAIGSGGLTGKGFMNGTQTKLKYVPEQDTDFIFCTVGEEQGFVGATIVLGLFLGLILRLIWLAERQSTTFGRVYGYSVVSIFIFHVAINVGMVIGLAPVIGIPLPFFSYGGSSLWGFTLLLFIFLRIDASDRKRLHLSN